MKIKNKIGVVLLGLTSIQAISQENNKNIEINKLNEVEITATSQSDKTLLKQAASISKLETKEIQRGTGLFFDDAVNTNIPGMFMQRRTVSAGQTFNIRGYGNGVRGTNGTNSNFDSQGVKVYLNNIPVTDAEGITLMDDIDFNSIGEVEVLKGPAGSLYGLAIAGAVNLKTIKPEAGKTSISQNTMFGSYGLRRLTSQIAVGSEKSSFLVNYGNQKYDGFMNHTASKKDFVNIFADFGLSNKQKINAYVGYTNSYEERNGELTIAQYQNLDYSGNPAYIKNNAHSNVISFRAGLNHFYQIYKNLSNSTSVFGSGISSNVSSAGGWTDKLPVNYGFRSTFDSKWDLGNEFKLSGITGVEMQMQNAQTLAYPMGNPVNAEGYNTIGVLRSNLYVLSKTNSVFTEWTFNMPYDFALTAGISSNYMRIDSNDRFPYIYNPSGNPQVTQNSKPLNFNVSYKDMYSPKVAISKVFYKSVSVYASYNKAYKAPVSGYLFIPEINQVNSNLRPEIGEQWEVGTKGKLLEGRLGFELAAFRTNFKDKMSTVSVTDPANTTKLYTYMINGGSQLHKGVEGNLKFEMIKTTNGFLKSFAPFVNGTYSDFTYPEYKFSRTTTGANIAQNVYDFSGLSVLGTPKWVANAGVDFLTKLGIYGNVTFNHRGTANFGYVPVDRTNPNLQIATADKYNLLHAKLGLKINVINHLDLDVFSGVNNITNVQYYQMVFVNQMPDAYIPAPLNATFFGGLNVKYTF
ncbi:TonB-dependent receptor [Flavobacterium columnare]|uniref:TonB-dependent receptor n=1 Tax=Flavobacterium columnare TaxID=996 RepID=UPI0007F9B852|nr:TonB-dependent receptor [Flavobacterium columnare]ANO47734.1 TonB-dependent receptor [Flavobacterium columnare]APT21652.1 TonB-dependent receptor [Flavobacterium columnare]PDS25329.1 TonB-dependent receptor [Flavobacterium columnare] [Flavobacterium columnare NBRC 100251 = ATCC 23463]QOG89028.1 TonB-dependent receptor [Flavobacterium columnare]QOG91687.1 TonB-dependent receptor [Flavobacterium columnare]